MLSNSIGAKNADKKTIYEFKYCLQLTS